MITKRLLTLQVLLLFGLGSVLLLPRHTGLGPAGIAMTLPHRLGDWKGTDAPIAPEELKGLAPDTGFGRQFRTSWGYGTSPFDQVFVSIVLSGEDMSNSIHRPERCLAAQGWTVEHSARVRIPVAEGRAPLEVTRLTDVREARSKDGKTIGLKNLNYYWFIGSQDTTASHWTRTFIDAKDRVLHGENQRWAYVTVAAYVTDNIESNGRNEADTIKKVEAFIGEIVPRFQKPGAVVSEDAQDTTPKAQSSADAPQTPGI